MQALSVTNDPAQQEQLQPRSRLRLFSVLTGLNLSIFIAALDQTIVATAIPTIVSDLHSSSGYVWIGGAYLLANAAAGPIWAKLSDIWGRKPILLSAVAVFLFSSIICAKASSGRMLIAGRALQGAAGGGLCQMAYICISDMFSMRARSLYIGLTEIMWAIAGGVGPLLGGVLTERASWRFCWWINLPICGTTFILLLFSLDVHNPKTAIADGFKAIDWFGSLSILGVTLMLLLGLEFGGTAFAWNSPTVICLIIFGTIMIGVFIFSEKRLAQYPLMPMSLFKHSSNIACMAMCFFHGMIFISHEYYLPLYFQSALEASPSRSGVLIIPITLAEAIMAMLSGVLIHRTGRYLELLYVGATFIVIGNGLYCHFSATSSIGEIISFQIVAGVGAGLLFQAPMIALQAHVSQDDTATATATFNFVRNLAESLSIVIFGVIFQNSMDNQIKSLSMPPINLSPNITEQLSGGAAAANVMLVGKIQDPIQKFAVKVAFASSLRNMWIFCTCLAALTALSALFIKKLHLSKEHVETKTGIKPAMAKSGDVA
ncbi:hypothetical protein OIDMADRAFT_118289 [Oidiodendron maius Zn]|uniref:Major facilitator superfamily (MFS) profile domain-containing protein n=1 Tax=Oidiodendron maius (strain Zn) TaxID=913774 RepID=A0A0C3HKB2_OIDMZ|nr:hypothetical protein OIDMADRAFT_118289 [Oidiodendron maius Zn]